MVAGEGMSMVREGRVSRGGAKGGCRRSGRRGGNDFALLDFQRCDAGCVGWAGAGRDRGGFLVFSGCGVEFPLRSDATLKSSGRPGALARRQILGSRKIVPQLHHSLSPVYTRRTLLNRLKSRTWVQRVPNSHHELFSACLVCHQRRRIRLLHRWRHQVSICKAHNEPDYLRLSAAPSSRRPS